MSGGGYAKQVNDVKQVNYMRDKKIYNKAIAISEKDLNYLRVLKEKNNKLSLAGILAKIIEFYRSKYENNKMG